MPSIEKEIHFAEKVGISLASVYHITKEKSLTKNYTRKLVPDPFYVWKEVSTTSIEKIRYVIAKLSKFIQIDIQASSGSFLQWIIWKSFFVEFFAKNFSFAVLHKLTQFHYQTVFTFQVI